MMLKIDVFPHILPRRFFDRLIEVAPRSGLMVKRVSNIPVMVELEGCRATVQPQNVVVRWLPVPPTPLKAE